MANHSLWGNHRKPLDTILELHDLASFPHWTGSRRMSLNNFKLLEDHCKSLSGPFLWKHILPTHTLTHTLLSYPFQHVFGWHCWQTELWHLEDFRHWGLETYNLTQISPLWICLRSSWPSAAVWAWLQAYAFALSWTYEMQLLNLYCFKTLLCAVHDTFSWMQPLLMGWSKKQTACVPTL